MEWYSAGRMRVDVEDVRTWIAAESAAGRAHHYSDTVRTKIARGVLASLRDFGILRGAVRKEFKAPYLSPAGFAYVAWREYEQGGSARQLVAGRIWRRWLLDDSATREALAGALGLGVFRVSEAGSTVRVDWLAGSLQEVVDATTR